MKLHLPVRLFHIVVAVMGIVPSAMCAEYIASTGISIPARYDYETEVEDLSDIYLAKDFVETSPDFSNIAFRLSEDLYIETLNDVLMESGSGSYCFTSYTSEVLKSLSFSDNTTHLFEVDNGEYLEFIALQQVSFIENSNSGSRKVCGGAIYGKSSTISLNNNATVAFNGNMASGENAYGGAICGRAITMSKNGSVTFSGNAASGVSDSYGGAIYGDEYSAITLSNNGKVAFSGNAASYGGAIEGRIISLNYNDMVIFSGNSARYGGAVNGVTISLNYNDAVTFCDNEGRIGGAICGQYITLSHNGEVAFSGNTASYGSVIYGGDNSDIRLSYNDTVTFRGNSGGTGEHGRPGALAGEDDSSISLNNNDKVIFSENTAGEGAAISVGTNSSINLNNNGEVTFSGNQSTRFGGGAIRGSAISLCDNETVTFSGNRSTKYGGGAIYVESGISLNNNGEITFSENIASESTIRTGGGAIWGVGGATITLGGNGTVTFRGNSTKRYGGAIGGWSDSAIDLSENDTVAFNGNSAGIDGGALWSGGIISVDDNGTVIFNENTANNGGAIDGSTIMLNNNETVTFSGNAAYSNGGAIYGGTSANISLNDNGEVTFNGNTASSGSAIYGYSNSSISLNRNGEVTFNGNTASSGGAIYGYSNSSISLNNNGDVTFSENIGSAIEGESGSGIMLSGNGKVTFSGNEAFFGAAISGGTDSTIDLSDNGEVAFIENTANRSNGASGGAIAGSTIMLNNNETVTFSGNSVFASSYVGRGGAIIGDFITLNNNCKVTFIGNNAFGATYGYGAAIDSAIGLNIRNNDSVEFAGNFERSGSAYRLRSMYATGEVSLSAAAGKIIEFRDSVYIGSGSLVKLNEKYENIEQNGDIIFTGRTTDADLRTAKGSAGLDSEILASRTTEVYALTNLYGGRLRVEDGAIYQGQGIMVHEGSEASVLVKDATLNHAGYDLTFNSGTTLAVEGVSSISGNVVMLEGSNLALTVGAANSSSAVLTLDSAMDLQGVHLALNGAEYLLSGKYQLIHDSAYNAADWASDVLSIGGCESGGLAWENGVLTLTCTNTWNQAAEDGSLIGSVLGNLVVSGQAEVTLNGELNADLELQSRTGHLIIDSGVAHLAEGASVAGDVVFTGTQQAERTLVAEADTSLNSVVLATAQSESSSIEVSNGQEVELASVKGTGNLTKDGDGTLKHTGTSTEVQGNLVVNEGKLLNTGTLAFDKIQLNGGQLDNQGTITAVEINGGVLSGSGVFGGLTMKAGRLVVGNSPGFQQYTDDLHAEGGELVFSVGGVAEAATSSCKGWESTVYSNIDMGGNELYLGTDTTLTVALGGSMLENLTGDFSMVLFSNVGNIDSFTDGVLATLLESTRFIVTDEEAGVREGWEAGADLSSLVQNVAYSVSGTSLVLSGQFAAVPEPATATLSLLALAGLVMRRRRR